jgi:ABC-type lipoprotein release transport system permease subunit
MRRLMPPGMLLFLAWRSLLQSRLIAALLVLAVAAGVAFQIPNDANIRGYDGEILVQGVELGSGDVRVRPREGARFEDADALAATLRARPGVIAAEPVLLLPGALGKTGELKGAMVIGVDPGATRPPYRLMQGQALAKGDDAGLLAGTVLAERTRATVGDQVQLRVIFGDVNDDGPGDDEDAIGKYTMTLRGIAGGTFVAPQAIVVDRAFLAAELGEPGSASVIQVHLADHASAPTEAARIERDLPGVEARAWQVDSPFVSSALAGSQAVGLVSRLMVILAVLIPVWALLYVHVLHRQRQIGILGAVGLTRGEIFLAYLAQAVFVGAAGAAIGCGLGAALIAWFQAHPIFRSTDFVITPVVSPGTYLWPSLLVLTATLVAGVVPAWRASRIDPARILRGQL